MSRLDSALRRLAERGNPIGPDALLEELDRHRTSGSTPEVVTLDTRRKPMDTMPPTTDQGKPWWKGPRVPFLAAAVVVVLAVFAIVNLTGSDEPDVAATPDTVITAYRDAYNARDIDRLLELFTDQSVVDTGETIFGGPFTGLEQIRSHLVRELGIADEVDALQISEVQVSGNTVTWDQALTLLGGNPRYCSAGSSAVVEDGSILTLKLVLAQKPC